MKCLWSNTTRCQDRSQNLDFLIPSPAHSQLPFLHNSCLALCLISIDVTVVYGTFNCTKCFYDSYPCGKRRKNAIPSKRLRKKVQRDLLTCPELENRFLKIWCGILSRDAPVKNDPSHSDQQSDFFFVTCTLSSFV